MSCSAHPHHWFIYSGRLVCVAVILIAAAQALAQGSSELELGRLVEGEVREVRPTDYSFTADQPGILTIAIRARDGGDILFKVMEDEFDATPFRVFDIDYGGDFGAEHGLIVIPRAGPYLIRVEAYDEQVEYVMGATWLPFPQVGAESDRLAERFPNIDVGELEELPIGRRVDLETGHGTDFGSDVVLRYTPESSGFLTVFTRAAPDDDLVIEVYSDEHLVDLVGYADADTGGNLGDESITLDVIEGETYLIRIASLNDEPGLPFALRSFLTPKAHENDEESGGDD